MSGPLPVRIVASAAQAILDAAEWRTSNRPKAPHAFAEELGRAFQLIATQPAIGARAQNIRLAGVRRIHLARIHYHLYYRVSGSPAWSRFWHSGTRVADHNLQWLSNYQSSAFGQT